jgi:YVTN family beta-propeller protein
MLAMNKIYLGLGAVVTVALVGCSGAANVAGSSSPSESSGGGPSKGAAGSNGSGDFIPAADAGMPFAPVVLPPEQEQNFDFLAPRAGARYVYVANPTRDTVSIIDSTNLAITEVTTGDTPTYLATVVGQDVALVINVGAHTLSVLRGIAMDPVPVAVVPKANTISIAPDGLHAVVWFDASQTGATTTQTSTTTLTGSTQDVSVITLSSAGDQATSMTVGYQPSAVVFSSDGAAAFVVTDDGISSLRFAAITKPGIAPITHLTGSAVALVRSDAGAPEAGTADGGGSSVDGGTPLDLGKDTIATTVPPGTGTPIDVSVTPDGHYAIARRDGTAELLLVDLTAPPNSAVTSILLSSPVTDLDMNPAGTQAFAVLRDESKLVAIDLPDGFADIAHQTVWPLAGETIGSVTISASGKFAVLYTTALPITSLVILNLQAGVADASRVVAVDVRKAIRAVAIAPDEQTALVLHTKTAGSPTATGIDQATVLDRSFGYSVVRLADGVAKLQLTSADPNPFAITTHSEFAFVLLRDDTAGVRIAESIDLSSFQIADFALGSPPNSIAAMSSDTQVFVGQVHPEGRISFIDWTNNQVNSVTGFALNGRIQQ